MKTNILVCLVALLVCVVFVSGCTSISDQLGLKVGGSSAKAPSTGVGYGPTGGGSSNQTNQQNETIVAQVNETSEINATNETSETNQTAG